MAWIEDSITINARKQIVSALTTTIAPPQSLVTVDGGRARVELAENGKMVVPWAARAKLITVK